MPPEALGGAQQAEPDARPSHVAIAPTLDVARDVLQRADQILDAVRRRKEACSVGGNSGSRTVACPPDPLAHTGGGSIGMTANHVASVSCRGAAATLAARASPEVGPDVDATRLRDKGFESAEPRRRHP